MCSSCCVVVALNDLGQCYKEKGMIDEAIKTFEECLVALRSFLPRNHLDIGDS